MDLSKRILSLVIIISIIASLFMYMPAYAFKIDNDDAPQFLSDDSAYAVFGKNTQTRDVTVKYTKKTKSGGVFGIGGTTTESEITPATATYDGITGVKIDNNQYLYLNLDKTKFTGTKYLVVVKFYDPGSEEQFKIEYKDILGNTKEHKIQKTGMQAKWVTESFILDNVSTSEVLGQNSNLCISGVYSGGSVFTSATAKPFVISQIEIIDYSESEVYYDCTITPTSYTAEGRTSYYINYNGKPAIKPYVIAQSWNYQGTKFIFASYDTMEQQKEVEKEVVKEVTDPETGEPVIDETTGEVKTETVIEKVTETVTVTNPDSHKLYEYDIINHTVTCLDTMLSGSLDAIVTNDNQIYYAKRDGRTWKIDWLTYKKEPTNARTYGTMNVTNDGEWISGYGGAANYVMRSNTKTGDDDIFYINNANSIWKNNSNSQGKGHPMVNPMYPHLVFFCHEGTTTVIPDRLWLANYNTNLAYNMFLQTPLSGINTAETSGHEAWGANGENMYWVKYYRDTNAGQSGIMRMNKYGSDREYINGDYNHWHCYPSMDDNFVISDTNKSGHQIVITNTNTYEAKLISSLKNESGVHPNQPHPHISGNNYAANWQMMRNGKTCIGWNVVRDVTVDVKQTNRYSFGNGTEITTCENALSATTDYTKDGVAYKKADSGKGVYVDILNSVCASTNADVTLEISYLDIGTNPLCITYTTGVDDIYDISQRENATYEIAKTGTSTQKTATITLENINANTIGKFRSDINISSQDGVYISSVNAYCEPVGRELYTSAQIYSYASGIGAEQSKGLKILYGETGSNYNSTLWHVDDVEGWSGQGVTQELVDQAKSAGYNYVTEHSDGAWMYKQATDKSDFTRTAYFTTKNYRNHSTNKKIDGAFYLYLTDNTITENDNTVTFNITYLDGGNIKVVYTANTDTGLAEFTIPGTDSGLWKTALITVDNAKLSSDNTNTKLATQKEDIKIESRGDEMYIASVSVTKPEEGEDNGLKTRGIYYKGYERISQLSERISVYADNNVEDGGIICTEKANYSTYNSTLYHVEDVESWTKAGIKQETVDAAIENGIEYISPGVDGAWKYEEFTDADGVTKTAFYAPRNYRNSTGAKINSNLYFRLTDETITDEDKNIIVALEYLDVGNLTFQYVSETGISSYSVLSKKSGKWETAYINLSDAALSSTNSGTKLATWKDDIKIMCNGTPVAGITIMKEYDGSREGDYEILGKEVQALKMESGDVATPVAVVENKSNTDASVTVYNVIYDDENNIKSVEMGDAVTVFPGDIKEACAPERALLIGETQKLFVWNSNLMPLEKTTDPLGIMISDTPGSVKVWWNNKTYPGYFLNIYRGNEIVGRTNGDYCILDNLKKGTNTIYIDLADSFGRVIMRSKPLNVTVK